VMLTEFPPFDVPLDSDGRFRYIMQGNVPAQALDLLQRMITYADKRLSLDQVWSHPWVTCNDDVSLACPILPPLLLAFANIAVASQTKQPAPACVTAFASAPPSIQPIQRMLPILVNNSKLRNPMQRQKHKRNPTPSAPCRKRFRATTNEVTKKTR
jgi:hypothetical protein